MTTRKAIAGTVAQPSPRRLRVKFLGTPFAVMLFWVTIASFCGFQPATITGVLLCILASASFCLLSCALQAWWIINGHPDDLTPRQFCFYISFAAIISIAWCLIVSLL